MAADVVGVLLMAYGTPRNLDEVGPYYRSIRGAREPSAQEVQELAERYRRVGGRTPLLETTEKVAKALERRLNTGPGPRCKTYIGMKHWHPFIAETMRHIAADGIQRLIGFPLAPHYSRMSIDGYRSAVDEALQATSRPIAVRFIESWHGNPLFIQAMAQRIKEALRSFSVKDASEVEVVFTAHSLPRRILRWEDPYPQELLQSAAAVATAARVPSWRFSYQSASHTGDPWLGPDILETLSTLASEGEKKVLVVPIGFVSDNLEILYDLDTEAQELARGLGIELRRTPLPNESSDFIEALADVVVNGTGARTSGSF